MSLADGAIREWRALTTSDDTCHIVEIVHGGLYLYYCWQTRLSSMVFAAGYVEPITKDTPLTCLWCAAWWTP